MRKNILTLALAMAILFSATVAATVPIGTVSALEYGAFEYEVVNDGAEVNITGYNGPGGAISIPAKINGLPVTGIGNNSFFSEFAITSVTIPGSVRTIGIQAFAQCTALASVTIGDGVEEIGSWAFYRTNLTSVTIPKSVVSVGGGAFAYCSLLTAINVDNVNPVYNSVNGVLYNEDNTRLMMYPGGRAGAFTVPNGITAINGYAFFGSTGLTSLVMPSSILAVYDNATGSCPNLMTVIFKGDAPDDEYMIGTWAANHNPGLIAYYYEGAAGFTPVWKGVTTSVLGATATAPNALVAIPGDGVVTLIWSAPSHPGSPAVEEYVLYVDGAERQTVASTSLTVTGLSNDQEYSFSVAARNTAGIGQKSSTATATPLEGLPDVAAPTVIVRSPEGTGAVIGSAISVTFSEAMDQGSFSMVVSGVDGQISWSGNTAKFIPSSELAYGTTYTVTVSGKDVAGNSLAATSWSFTTAEETAGKADTPDNAILYMGIVAIVALAAVGAFFLRRKK